MLSDVIRNLERAENLRRDSELTTSTVETFVSERPVFTLNVPETVDKDNRVGDVERNAQELQQNKGCCFHFYHTHTGTILLLGNSHSLSIILQKLNSTSSRGFFPGVWPPPHNTWRRLQVEHGRADPAVGSRGLSPDGAGGDVDHEVRGVPGQSRAEGCRCAVRGSDLQVDVRELGTSV